MPPLAAELSVSDPLKSLSLTERKWNFTGRLVKQLPNNATVNRVVVKPELVQEQTVGFSK